MASKTTPKGSEVRILADVHNKSPKNFLGLFVLKVVAFVSFVTLANNLMVMPSVPIKTMGLFKLVVEVFVYGFGIYVLGCAAWRSGQ